MLGAVVLGGVLIYRYFKNKQKADTSAGADSSATNKFKIDSSKARTNLQAQIKGKVASIVKGATSETK